MFDTTQNGPRDTSIANELAKFLDDGQPKSSLTDDLRRAGQLLTTLKSRLTARKNAAEQGTVQQPTFMAGPDRAPER